MMFKFKRLFVLAAVAGIISTSLLGIVTTHKVNAAGTRQKLFILVPGFNTDTSSPNGLTQILRCTESEISGISRLRI